jgi:hypothetical protein
MAGEIILVALNVKESEVRVKFEVPIDGLENIPAIFSLTKASEVVGGEVGFDLEE